MEKSEGNFAKSEGNFRAWWPWVRRLRDINGKPEPWWFWTPVTYRFGHGGWVYLNLAWLWRFRRGA